jgi:hypothetical protein
MAKDSAAADVAEGEQPWWDFPTNDAQTWWWEAGRAPSAETLATLRSGLRAAARGYERLGKVDRAEDCLALAADLPVAEAQPRRQVKAVESGRSSEQTWTPRGTDYSRLRNVWRMGQR